MRTDAQHDTIPQILRDILAELFGWPQTRTRGADSPKEGVSRAELACALEALRYYLDISARAPTRADVRWYHARADEIFAEFMQRNS